MISARDVPNRRDVRACYDRIAPYYDCMEDLAETRHRDWRRGAWALVKGPRVLEVGVGTGRNMACYPPEVQVTGVDLSAGMLERAQQRAVALTNPVSLLQMNVQALGYADAAYDCAIATFVFCSVVDPAAGLREIKRVVRPGGRIILLERVRAARRLLTCLMDLFDPLGSGLMGAHINRETIQNVRHSGLGIVVAEPLDGWGIFRLIVARGQAG